MQEVVSIIMNDRQSLFNIRSKNNKEYHPCKIMYGLQNSYVSGGWGDGGGGGSSLAWTEDDEKTVSSAKKKKYS